MFRLTWTKTCCGQRNTKRSSAKTGGDPIIEQASIALPLKIAFVLRGTLPRRFVCIGWSDEEVLSETNRDSRLSRKFVPTPLQGLSLLGR